MMILRLLQPFLTINLTLFSKFLMGIVFDRLRSNAICSIALDEVTTKWISCWLQTHRVGLDVFWNRVGLLFDNVLIGRVRGFYFYTTKHDIQDLKK